MPPLEPNRDASLMIKCLVTKVTSCLLLLFLILGLTGCNSNTDRDLNRNKTLLDEADLYLEFSQITEAKAKATEAIRNLDLLMAKKPSDIPYLLLHARALITKFLITNSSIIAEAPIQAKSLIRIPHFNNYIGYDKYISIAILDLKRAQEINPLMKSDQSAALHAMLASIYRLQMSSMSKANVQYKLSIKAYHTYLQELEKDKKPIGNHNFAITQIKNQIRLLTISRAEVKLAMHKWNKALRVLKKMMGGADFDFFDVTFNKIETKIANLKNESKKEHTSTPEKARAISEIVTKKRSPSNKSKELAGYSSYQINVMQAEIELASLKNNLMYRIICYYWLGNKSQYEQGRMVLRKYYPALDSELSYLLKGD